MRHDRLIRPGHRKGRVSTKPSHAVAEHPFHDYFVLSRDSHGTSSSVSFGAPPNFVRLAAMIREGKTMPFETVTDVYRWAVLHGLQELVKRAADKELTGEYSTIQNMVAVAAKEADALAYQDNLTKIFKTVRRLLQDGHPGKATEIAEFVWRNCDKIGDPYWRRHYRVQAKKVLDQIKRGEYELKRRKDDEDEAETKDVRASNVSRFDRADAFARRR